MLPAPWIVSWFVNVSVTTPPKIKLFTLFDSVTVPPLRVTFPACTSNSVTLPVELTVTVPKVG